MELLGVPIMVVLVAAEQIFEPISHRLTFDLQARFHIPVLLVAREDEFWTGATAYSRFNTQLYLMELVFLRDASLEWNELRDRPIEELPF